MNLHYPQSLPFKTGDFNFYCTDSVILHTHSLLKVRISTFTIPRVRELRELRPRTSV
ncbi:MAG: hypothetical protein K8R52_06465 [Bacteroidales bacterium]|nr:hypothetical protein [Bacteroidales bacterium]